jgi:SAM-dependent methyltransferase
MSTASPPLLLGYVELPSSTDVTGHNGRVCRFQGWVASTAGRPTTVRVSRRGVPRRVLHPSADRPDVAAVLASEHPGAEFRAFEFYVNVPRTPWRRTVALEFSDGENATPPMVYRLSPTPDGLLETYVPDNAQKRALAARWLRGRGLEFGALHQPMPVGPDVTSIQYADRLTRDQALEVFPDLGPWSDSIVEPDFVVDLDHGDLSSIADEAFDFFVANDVIEHLANPARFLESVHGVMKPGARLFLCAPDRRYTQDVNRRRTRARHLWREYQDGVTEVDDAHVEDWLRSAGIAIPADEPRRQEFLDSHRVRSVHAHVWDNRSFGRFLHLVIRWLSLSLDVVDSVSSREAGGGMIYVLERR